MYESVARRIHSMYFLGTPHRGGDSAQLLRSFLAATVGVGEKAFLEELQPGSRTLQVRRPLTLENPMLLPQTDHQ